MLSILERGYAITELSLTIRVDPRPFVTLSSSDISGDSPVIRLSTPTGRLPSADGGKMQNKPKKIRLERPWDLSSFWVRPLAAPPAALPHPLSRARTFSLSSLPSTRLPASFAWAAFITTPICFTVVTPVSSTAATTAASISSSVASAGM